MKVPDPLPVRTPFWRFQEERVMLDTTLTAEELTAQLGGSWTGGSGTAICPAHKDTKPSLSISNKPGGGILVHCHSRCTQDEVIAELRNRNLWPAASTVKSGRRTKKAEHWEVVDYYDYRDEHGDPSYRTVRWSNHHFTHEKWCGDTYASYKGCMDNVPRLPYLLPELLQAKTERLVFVVEGEKDALSVVEQLRLVASCNSGGARHWQPEITKWFEGRDCIIVPDNDTAGRAHAVIVGKALSGIAAKVRVLELPDLAEGGDISDWIEGGGTRSELVKLAKSAADFEQWYSGTDVIGELVLDPNDPRACAKAFLASTYKNSRLILYDGTFYAWQRSHYIPLELEALHGQLYTMLEKAHQPSIKRSNTPFKPDKKKIDNIVHALKPMVHVEKKLLPPCWLDGRDDSDLILACSNGLLRFRDEVLLPHDSNYFNLSSTEYDYDPDPPEPVVWNGFLDSCFPGDGKHGPDNAASIDAIHQHMGLVASGDRRWQKILFHCGLRRAGKGVILHTLQWLLGGAAHVSFPIVALANDGFNLEPIIGKLLVAVPDARGERLSPQVVESLLTISGGDDMTLKQKYKGAVTMKPQSVPWILSNTVPRLPDTSGTIASRFEIVKYRNSFYGREDLDLEEKLVPELPGILKLAIKGYRRLLTQGHFTQPESGLVTAMALRRMASSVIGFIEDEYVLDARGVIPTKELYDDYCRWFVDTHQQGDPDSDTGFGMHLLEGYPENVTKGRPMHKARRQYCYFGLRKRERGDRE